MGFECALALVVPEPGTLIDYVSREGEASPSDDIFSEQEHVLVSARIWRVFKFIDFGRVRTLVKSSSSLTPAERASGKFDDRAAKCTASFLLDRFFACERKVVDGNLEYAVPFIADHYSLIRWGLPDEIFSFSFAAAFEQLGSNDAVVGLKSMRDRFSGDNTPLTSARIFQGALWEHNNSLLKEHVVAATTLSGKWCESPCGLVWASAHDVAHWLSDLLTGGEVPSTELRKDPLSVALVTSWLALFAAFAQCGVRAVILTGYLHSDAHPAMRLQSEYL